MDGYKLAVGIFVLLMAGFFVGLWGANDDLKTHCEKYGKHITDGWTLTCTKNKGE